MRTTILLYGSLGKRFGKKWILDVHTPKEIVDAISNKFPEFRSAILAMRDVDFGVTVGGNEIAADLWAFPNYGETITITPVVRGSDNSKGWIQVIAGVVLIAGSLVIDFYTQGAFGRATNYATYFLGVSLILGGVAALLAPSPQTQGDAESKTKPSYQFSTIINTLGQGECVPVFYGGDTVLGMWIGSAVVSAEYESVDITKGSTSGAQTSNVGIDQAGRPIFSQHDFEEP